MAGDTVRALWGAMGEATSRSSGMVTDLALLRQGTDSRYGGATQDARFVSAVTRSGAPTPHLPPESTCEEFDHEDATGRSAQSDQTKLPRFQGRRLHERRGGAFLLYGVLPAGGSGAAAPRARGRHGPGRRAGRRGAAAGDAHGACGG